MTPLKCAHCGETRSREGFVALTEEAIISGPDVFGGSRWLPRGALLRIECARELGAAIPETTSYLITETV